MIPFTSRVSSKNKLARLGALCHRYIKLHALNVKFFAQLFSRTFRYYFAASL